VSDSASGWGRVTSSPLVARALIAIATVIGACRNFESMAISAWLALPVTIAIASGAFVPSSGSEKRARSVALAAVASFALALVYMYLKLPIYSTIKASYMLGLTGCFGMLGACGLRPLMANAWLRAATFGWLACWGVSAYASYFVI
jgi:hypothetical protein